MTSQEPVLNLTANMKNLLLALMLAALSLTAVLWLLQGASDDLDDLDGAPDAGAYGPEQFAVLSGEGNGVEVLLRPRFQDAARRRFTDRSFTQALGIKAGTWTFLEAIVVNVADREIPDVDPSTIELMLTNGERVPARDLRDLAADEPRARILVDAFTVAEGTPLPGKQTRRIVVAVPSETPFGDVKSARWMGLTLEPRTAGRHALESWLGKPRVRFLEAVLEPLDDATGGDRG